MLVRVVPADASAVFVVAIARPHPGWLCRLAARAWLPAPSRFGDICAPHVDWSSGGCRRGVRSLSAIRRTDFHVCAPGHSHDDPGGWCGRRPTSRRAPALQGPIDRPASPCSAWRRFFPLVEPLPFLLFSQHRIRIQPGGPPGRQDAGQEHGRRQATAADPPSVATSTPATPKTSA